MMKMRIRMEVEGLDADGYSWNSYELARDAVLKTRSELHSQGERSYYREVEVRRHENGGEGGEEGDVDCCWNRMSE